METSLIRRRRKCCKSSLTSPCPSHVPWLVGWCRPLTTHHHLSKETFFLFFPSHLFSWLVCLLFLSMSLFSSLHNNAIYDYWIRRQRRQSMLFLDTWTVQLSLMTSRFYSPPRSSLFIYLFWVYFLPCACIIEFRIESRRSPANLHHCVSINAH